MGAVPARRKQAEADTRGRPRDGRDPVPRGSRLVGPLPAHAEGGRPHEDGLRAAEGCGGGRGLDRTLAGGEGAPCGTGGVLPWRIRVPCREAVGEAEAWGQRFFVFHGRAPARQPDYGEALKALRGTGSGGIFVEKVHVSQRSPDLKEMEVNKYRRMYVLRIAYQEGV